MWSMVIIYYMIIYLVERVNSTPPVTLSSEQCEDHLAANSKAAQDFIEDMELSVINQDLIQT